MSLERVKKPLHSSPGDRREKAAYVPWGEGIKTFTSPPWRGDRNTHLPLGRGEDDLYSSLGGESEKLYIPPLETGGKKGEMSPGEDWADRHSFP